ncbi:MAG: HIT domain-containing protein [Planctomycetia bacterium]|nr:HIT domain-containing protein [Planctomycetia bacterium]
MYENLWAPWRLAYIAGEGERSTAPAPPLKLLPGGDESCFACRAVADDRKRDRQNLLVARGKTTVTFLNRYPYNNGHLLVLPLAHKDRLERLTPDELLESQQTIACWVDLLESTMKAEGFNIGLNLGRAAGAGLPGHVHWHVVPRWHGDTNFMPALAGVKVIPQSLDDLWDLLHKAWGASSH